MQSKTESLIEQVLNIGSGFVISLFIFEYVIVPLADFDVTFIDNLWITGIFTFASVIRGYLWRRYFNYRTIRKMYSND